MAKIRGFEEVLEKHKTAFNIFTDEKKVQHKFLQDIKLPTRADEGSAGYDFYLPKDLTLLPAQKTIVFTDVKVFMQPGEVLEIYIRSSLAIKKGLMLSNNVGIIDASYYGNESNDGNIGIALVNTTGKTIELIAGERIAQGIFKNFLVADVDEVQSETRTGGIGSSGK